LLRLVQAEYRGDKDRKPMGANWSPFVALLLVCAVADIVATAFVWRRRGSVGRISLCLALLAAAAWSITYALELAAAPASNLREIGGSLEYLGTTLLPPAWLIFALQYSGRLARVGTRLRAALAVEPLLILSLLAVPATRALVRSYPPGPPQPIPQPRLGVAYWCHFTYTNLLVLSGSTVLLITIVRSSSLYWRQSISLLVAIALPLVANAMSSIELPPFQNLDPTPVALTLAACVLVFGVLRYRLLDLRPVALGLVMETIRDAVLVVDTQNRLVDFNPEGRRLIDRTGPDALGRPLTALLPEQAAILSRADPGTYDLRLVANGADLDLEATVTRLPHPSSADGGRVLMFRDVTERRRLERDLRSLAYTDPVTGLANRALFYDRLNQALTRASRHGTALGVLFLDLDRFKIINDSLGHEIGDLMLAAVGHRLRHVLRGEDTLARLGGDEFAILLPDITSAHDTARVADKILNVLTAPQLISGHELTVDVSIGVALFPEDGRDGPRLMRSADAAMYSAKARGGGRAERFAPGLAREASRRQQLEADLRRGLRTGQLRLEFQPIHELAGGGIVGYEALVRWDHPRNGLMKPASFLPLAEDTGLIEAVDAWVLYQACRQARQWSSPLVVSINLSPAGFKDVHLAQKVTHVLAETGLQPSRLTLELNERIPFDDEPEAFALLADLSSVGVGLALDDFGAGYTSLRHMRRLTITDLKIDRSLVLELDGQGAESPIVAAVISFAHTLGLSVTAEGVEHPQQVERLRQLGCEHVQGFLIGRPQASPRPGVVPEQPRPQR
jgi:diguanylate cyclase (GGDEF)-like protein